MDAFTAIMRHIMAGRDPNFDVRSRSGMVPERRSAAPFLIFCGQSPVGMPSQDPFDFFFNGGHYAGHRGADFGDLFMGYSLHVLIEQLSMNDRRGPAPAPRSAIDAMPTIMISQRHLNTDAHCPVCQDKFELGSKARQMPCDHIYHNDCSVPWLAEYNSCPICHVELPSQGSGSARPNWNQITGNASSSGSSSNRRDSSSSSKGRWNPFSFLWPSNSTNQNTQHRSNTEGNRSSSPHCSNNNACNYCDVM